jgi:hypothetical protein
MLSNAHMHYPAGISVCTDDAVAPEFYRFNSRWDGMLRGQRVTVFAGSLRGDPSKGVLLVHTLPKDTSRRYGRHVAGPADCGSLRLVGWSGNRLKLLAENGESIWYAL